MRWIVGGKAIEIRNAPGIQNFLKKYSLSRKYLNRLHIIHVRQLARKNTGCRLFSEARLG
jgi:hypothetical protein